HMGGALYVGYSICVKVPHMISETYYVDVCDETGDKYRFGYNTQEKVNEISGIGNHNTAEFWEYDTRLGRRWNIDPKAHLAPGWSPYRAFCDTPILYSDPDGGFDIPIHKEITETAAKLKKLTASQTRALSWGAQNADYLGFAEDWHF